MTATLQAASNALPMVLPGRFIFRAHHILPRFIAPADLGTCTFVVNTRQPEGIERLRTRIEKHEIGSCSFVMPRVDTLVLAVVDPKAIVNHRHARAVGGRGQFVEPLVAGAIHGNSRERPLVGFGGGAVDSVPAM